MVSKVLSFSTRFWMPLFVFLVVFGDQAASETLQHLFLVYRHGDRAPISLYAKDPNPSSYWKEGLGQLTNKGKMQHFMLGTYLRERYRTFLSDNIQEVYVRSSAVDRCLESAASSLASLYKPSGFWVWNKNLTWQPAPIHSTPVEIDPMLTTDSICPEADKEIERIKESEEAQSFLKRHSEFFKIISNYTGQRVNDWNTADHVHDVLLIEKLYNLTIPDWVQEIWTELSEVTDFSFYIPFSTQLSQRLRGGSLVGDIVSKMNHRVDNISSPARNASVLTKVNIYSTHDNVLSAFLSALGVFNKRAPPYFSTVMIELHQNGLRNHTVRVFYRNDTSNDPYPLTIPGCEFDCPLGHFVRLTEDVVPINWKEECGLKDANQALLSTALIITIGTVGAVLLLLTLSMALMLWLRCQKEKSEVRYHRVPELKG